MENSESQNLFTPQYKKEIGGFTSPISNYMSSKKPKAATVYASERINEMISDYSRR